jgi:excisionase family DNA binding protein
MNDPKPVLLSPIHAARALDIGKTSIYALMRRGAIGYVIVGTERRIPMTEVQRVAAQGAPAK